MALTSSLAQTSSANKSNEDPGNQGEGENEDGEADTWFPTLTIVVPNIFGLDFDGNGNGAPWACYRPSVGRFGRDLKGRSLIWKLWNETTVTTTG